MKFRKTRGPNLRTRPDKGKPKLSKAEQKLREREEAIRKQKRRLINTRLVLLGKKFDTTAEHVESVATVIGIIRLEKISLVEFQEMFGQTGSMRREAAIRRRNLEEVALDEMKRRERIMDDLVKRQENDRREAFEE